MYNFIERKTEIFLVDVLKLLFLQYRSIKEEKK
jgi:hypothetical protein